MPTRIYASVDDHPCFLTFYLYNPNWLQNYKFFSFYLLVCFLKKITIIEHLDIDTLPSLYKTPVHPILEYANFIWGPYYSQTRNYTRKSSEESYQTCTLFKVGIQVFYRNFLMKFFSVYSPMENTYSCSFIYLLISINPSGCNANVQNYDVAK